jgi:predicted Holliday junction resolvase-like endonuclease
MTITVSLLLGIIIGGVLAYLIVHKTQHKIAIAAYESQLEALKKEHEEAVKKAKNRSLDGSRAVIKGKVAEQFLPILPAFKYMPSDARFIGDPIDYVIFNGYTELKDNRGDRNNLEIILLDVKTGKASLTQHQKAILEAAQAGRIRFETIRL